jgi:hypothetical protein
MSITYHEATDRYLKQKHDYQMYYLEHQCFAGQSKSVRTFVLLSQ